MPYAIPRFHSGLSLSRLNAPSSYIATEIRDIRSRMHFTGNSPAAALSRRPPLSVGRTSGYSFRSLRLFITVILAHLALKRKKNSPSLLYAAYSFFAAPTYIISAITDTPKPAAAKTNGTSGSILYRKPAMSEPNMPPMERMA